MKIRINYYLIILLFSVSFTFCTDNKSNQENKKNNNKVFSPEIIHLKNTYYSKFYFFKNFQENETNIKFLFDFINKNNGHLDIVSDESSIRFEDGYSVDDFNSIRFAFARDGETLHNTYIRVNFLNSEKINFQEKHEKGKAKLFANFNILNLNILQNFLDYAKENELKKSQETYNYELYNKDKIKKAVLYYHNFGKWFEIDIL